MSESPDNQQVVPLTPWVIQGAVFETIQNYLLNHPPSSIGYPIDATYDKQSLKSGIYLDIAYNYDKSTANKRPAIFVSRTGVQTRALTLGGAVAIDPAESSIGRLLVNSMNVNIAVISAPIMAVELLADYVRQCIVAFQREIAYDFKLRRFRLASLSQPQVFSEAKEFFVINLGIETVFDDNILLHRDDLKLWKFEWFDAALTGSEAPDEDVVIPPIIPPDPRL